MLMGVTVVKCLNWKLLQNPEGSILELSVELLPQAPFWPLTPHWHSSPWDIDTPVPLVSWLNQTDFSCNSLQLKDLYFVPAMI